MTAVGGTITVCLEGDGKKTVEVPRGVAMRFGLIARFFEDDASSDTHFPVSNVDESTFILVVRFACMLADHPQIENAETEHALEEAFSSALAVPEKKSVLAATIYLDFPRLLACVARSMARDLSNMTTVDEIRAYLGVENDYKPEEESRLREALAFALV